MSPPALEKMDDAKPVILVSNSSRTKLTQAKYQHAKLAEIGEVGFC